MSSACRAVGTTTHCIVCMRECELVCVANNAFRFVCCGFKQCSRRGQYTYIFFFAMIDTLRSMNLKLKVCQVRFMLDVSMTANRHCCAFELFYFGTLFFLSFSFSVKTGLLTCPPGSLLRAPPPRGGAAVFLSPKLSRSTSICALGLQVFQS